MSCRGTILKKKQTPLSNCNCDHQKILYEIFRAKNLVQLFSLPDPSKSTREIVFRNPQIASTSTRGRPITFTHGSRAVTWTNCVQYANLWRLIWLADASRVSQDKGAISGRHPGREDTHAVGPRRYVPVQYDYLRERRDRRHWLTIPDPASSPPPPRWLRAWTNE